MNKTASNAMDDALDYGMNALPNTNSMLSISQPPEWILKILIIQSRDNVKTALERYYSDKGKGINPDISKFKARTIGLFFEIRNSFQEDYNKTKEPKTEPFEAFETKLLEAKDFKTLYDVNVKLNDFLYKKKLIKFDNREAYDSTRVEVENRAKNL